MSATNTVAQELETHGVHTFSTRLYPWSDSDTPTLLQAASPKCSIVLLPATMQLISRLSMVLRASMSFSRSTVNVVPRANFKFDFPALESTSTLEQLSKMRGSYRKLLSSPVSLKLDSFVHTMGPSRTVLCTLAGRIPRLVSP